MPSADTTGNKNLKVEPLSIQLRVAFLLNGCGVTVIAPLPTVISAPILLRHSAVATISFDKQLQLIFVGLSDKAAQIKSLCASDFDEIAFIRPERRDGVHLISI